MGAFFFVHFLLKIYILLWSFGIFWSILHWIFNGNFGRTLTSVSTLKCIGFYYPKDRAFMSDSTNIRISNVPGFLSNGILWSIITQCEKCPQSSRTRCTIRVLNTECWSGKDLIHWILHFLKQDKVYRLCLLFLIDLRWLHVYWCRFFFPIWCKN